MFDSGFIRHALEKQRITPVLERRLRKTPEHRVHIMRRYRGSDAIDVSRRQMELPLVVAVVQNRLDSDAVIVQPRAGAISPVRRAAAQSRWRDGMLSKYLKRHAN